MHHHTRFLGVVLTCWTLLLSAGGALAADIYYEGRVLAPAARIYPSYNSKSAVGSVKKGALIRVYGAKGTRYLIRFQRNLEQVQGWVDRTAVQKGRLIKPKDTVGARKTFTGTVVTENAVVYERPDRASAVVSRLARSSPVEIVSQTPEWYRLRIAYLDGSVGSGWVEKPNVRLAGSAPTAAPVAPPVIAAPAVAPPPPPPPSPPPPGAESVEPAARSGRPVLRGLRLAVSPVYNIRKFGTTQLRASLSYDYAFNDLVSVGASVNYSFLSGFSSIQGGVDLLLALWRPIEKGVVYSRTGLGFERFSGSSSTGSDVSFYAASGVQGFGFEYRLAERLGLFIEPAVDIAFWNNAEAGAGSTSDLPMFVRGLALVGVRGVF